MTNTPQKLSDTAVKSLPVPDKGNRVYYDTEVRGFGVRVTARGSRSFILNYRTKAGLERRYTIGSLDDPWKISAARSRAKTLKAEIELGGDPQGAKANARGADTVNDLCDRFERDYLPRKRPSTAADYKLMIKKYIRPRLGLRKVAEIEYTHVDRLHQNITKAGHPYRANRVVAVLSKMMNLAIKWHLRGDNPMNPTRGVERNQEPARERFLSSDELERLTTALARHQDKTAVNIIRLLLLTGARRGEVLSMRWHDLDLTQGIWTKPGATTKQKTQHRVPLSAPARQLLNEIESDADDDSVFVFLGRGVEHRKDIKKNWRAIYRDAMLMNVRIHDLRHSFASMLASGGMSLPIIGKLLGHTQAQTTLRYAHLFDDPLRQATERVGAIVSGQPSAAIVPLKATG